MRLLLFSFLLFSKAIIAQQSDTVYIDEIDTVYITDTVVVKDTIFHHKETSIVLNTIVPQSVDSFFSSYFFSLRSGMNFDFNKTWQGDSVMKNKHSNSFPNFNISLGFQIEKIFFYAGIGWLRYIEESQQNITLNRFDTIDNGKIIHYQTSKIKSTLNKTNSFDYVICNIGTGYVLTVKKFSFQPNIDIGYGIGIKGKASLLQNDASIINKKPTALVLLTASIPIYYLLFKSWEVAITPKVQYINRIEKTFPFTIGLNYGIEISIKKYFKSIFKKHKL